MCATNLSGTYDTVKRWLRSLGNTEPATPEKDVIAVFDNNQIMQRRWRVKLNYEMHRDVVTMLIFPEMTASRDVHSQFQTSKPSTWLNKQLSDVKLEYVSFVDQQEEIQSTHYIEHLPLFLTIQFKKFAEEQQLKDDVLEDKVDVELKLEEKREKFKTCNNCQFDEVKKVNTTAPIAMLT